MVRHSMSAYRQLLRETRQAFSPKSHGLLWLPCRLLGLLEQRYGQSPLRCRALGTDLVLRSRQGLLPDSRYQLSYSFDGTKRPYPRMTWNLVRNRDNPDSRKSRRVVMDSRVPSSTQHKVYPHL